MVVGMAIIFTGFVYSLTVGIIYFYKKRIKNFETLIYNILVILSLCNLIIEFWLCCNILAKVELYSFYNLLVNRTFLLFIFFWFATFLVYMMSVSFDKNAKLKQKLIEKYSSSYKKALIKKCIPVFLIVVVMLLTLPIKLISDGTYAYSDGPAIYVLYGVLGLSIIVSTLCIFHNRKSVDFKKFIPFAGVIVCFVIVLAARGIIPGLLLNSFALAFPTFLMYHTIENPDMKMIEQLNNAKEKAEQYVNDKSMFLFNMSQKIKEPVNTIEKINTEINESLEKEELAEKINLLKLSTERLTYIVNDALDISINPKYKIIETQYNIKNLLAEIILKEKSKLNRTEIYFKQNINKSLPEILFGDSIKIKQILNSIFSTLNKNSTNGVISFNVSSINTKDNTCRLNINICHTNLNLKIEEINNAFEKKNDEEEIDYTEVDVLNLRQIKKVINLLGGTILVQSNSRKDITFNIIIEQKTSMLENNKTLELIKDYKDMKKEKTKILVIHDDEKFINYIKKQVNTSIYEIISAIGGQECLERIRNKENFDLILLDEKLKKLDSLTTFERLKRIVGFNIPVVIMSESSDKKEFQRFNILGFNGILLKPIKLKELTELLNKYTKNKNNN